MEEFSELNAIILSSVLSYVLETNPELKNEAKGLLHRAVDEAYNQGWNDRAKSEFRATNG